MNSIRILKRPLILILMVSINTWVDNWWVYLQLLLLSLIRASSQVGKNYGYRVLAGANLSAVEFNLLVSYFFLLPRFFFGHCLCHCVIVIKKHSLSDWSNIKIRSQYNNIVKKLQSWILVSSSCPVSFLFKKIMYRKPYQLNLLLVLYYAACAVHKSLHTMWNSKRPLCATYNHLSGKKKL